MRAPRRAVRELSGYITKRERWTPLPRDVELPPPFDEADRSALVACRDGHASPEQQKRALGWLLFAAGDVDQSYRSASVYDTCFASGRRSVALAMRLVLETPPRKSGEQG